MLILIPEKTIPSPRWGRKWYRRLYDVVRSVLSSPPRRRLRGCANSTSIGRVPSTVGGPVGWFERLAESYLIQYSQLIETAAAVFPGYVGRVPSTVGGPVGWFERLTESYLIQYSQLIETAAAAKMRPCGRKRKCGLAAAEDNAALRPHDKRLLRCLYATVLMLLRCSLIGSVASTFPARRRPQKAL